MSFIEPVVLSGRGVRLEPLRRDHEEGLAEAAADGELWRIRVANVPAPGRTGAYIEELLRGQAMGAQFHFAVVEEDGGRVLGTTGYHGVLPEVRRLEIGYTWYARRVQRSAVNTVCKMLLLTHAFDELGCRVVGWRTDVFNLASQRAIERLGAHRDGVVRGDKMRRDGTVRDTVLYSLTAGEWPEVRAHLAALLDRR